MMEITTKLIKAINKIFLKAYNCSTLFVISFKNIPISSQLTLKKYKSRLEQAKFSQCRNIYDLK
jgi:hypothetical protein